MSENVKQQTQQNKMHTFFFNKFSPTTHAQKINEHIHVGTISCDTHASKDLEKKNKEECVLGPNDGHYSCRDHRSWFLNYQVFIKATQVR